MLRSVVCRELKCANCLKNKQKSFVDSDFMCIFARFLCALRPRALHVSGSVKGVKFQKVSELDAK